MFVGVFENNNNACGLMVWHFASTGLPDVFMRSVRRAAANKYFTLAVFQRDVQSHTSLYLF